MAHTNNENVAPETEPLIGKTELAQRMKIKPRTLKYWMQRGWLPYYKLGRSVAFRASEVEAFLQKRRVEG